MRCAATHCGVIYLCFHFRFLLFRHAVHIFALAFAFNFIFKGCEIPLFNMSRITTALQIGPRWHHKAVPYRCFLPSLSLSLSLSLVISLWLSLSLSLSCSLSFFQTTVTRFECRGWAVGQCRMLAVQSSGDTLHRSMDMDQLWPSSRETSSFPLND